MKKIGLAITVLVMLVLTGCGKKGQDLLSTVPKSSDFYAIVNLEQINKDLGNKVDGSKIELSDKFEDFIGVFGKNGDKFLEALSNNDYKIDFSSPVVIFAYDNDVVATFNVTDPGAFRKNWDEEQNSGFSESNGVWRDSDDKAFMIDRQVWLVSHSGVISSVEIKKFASLEEDESLSSLKIVGSEVNDGAAIEYFWSLSKAFQAGGSDGAQLAMVLNMALEDPAYGFGSVRFDESKAVASIRILNSDFEPAKRALNSKPLNKQSLKDYPGKGDLFYAIALDKTQIDNALSQFGSMAGIPREVSDVLSTLDGELVGSFNTASFMGRMPVFGLQISFTYAAAASNAGNLVRSYGAGMINVEVKGNKLYVYNDGLSGASIDDVASKMEGASAAMVVDTKPLLGTFNASLSRLVPYVSVVGKEKGDSIIVEFTVFTEEGQNSLLSILEFIKKGANYFGALRSF